MSLVSWKKEFYPIKASAKLTTREAIQHSLRKWQGLTLKNLAKHNITRGYSSLEYRGSKFPIDSTTCALCYKFFNKNDLSEQACLQCPLYQLHNQRCDYSESYNTLSLYNTYIFLNNPKPMIKALKDALKNLNMKGKVKHESNTSRKRT